MSKIEEFQEVKPSLESYWRSVILFGRNVASYKFALAKSLTEIIKLNKTEVTLEELAEPFSRNLCDHLISSPKQITSNRSQFISACKNYNAGELDKPHLLDVTRRLGFNNVIDAFHVVNRNELPVKFYEKDYSRSNKKIIITDNLFKLYKTASGSSLDFETEARWKLVETAWELGLSRNLLTVNYDDEIQELYVKYDLKRKDVTSVRAALNGYQKGKCFYCFDDISVNPDDRNLCDVDHFFPHTLKSFIPDINFDGVWNLVLSCKDCNRGEDGKFAMIPAVKYLDRLYKRNEFLISSHHPLRETLMQQTGATEVDRRLFIRVIDREAINSLIFRWETDLKGDEVF